MEDHSGVYRPGKRSHARGIFGEAVIAILATIAKQERLRLSERTRAGMERARKEGKQIGRPSQREEIKKRATEGEPPAAIARRLNLARSTVWRALNPPAGQ